MRKDIAAGAFVALMLAMVALPGCWKRGGTKAAAETSSTITASSGKPTFGSIARDLQSAPAVQAVVDMVQPYKWLGPALVLLGVAAFCAGKRGAGLSLAAMGGMASYIGAALIQFPWLALLIALAAGVWIVVLAIQESRTKARAAVIVDAVNNAEHKAEITGAIKAQGAKTAAFVDALVTPIERMRDGKGAGGIGAMFGKWVSGFVERRIGLGEE